MFVDRNLDIELASWVNHFSTLRNNVSLDVQVQHIKCYSVQFIKFVVVAHYVRLWAAYIFFKKIKMFKNTHKQAIMTKTVRIISSINMIDPTNSLAPGLRTKLDLLVLWVLSIALGGGGDAVLKSNGSNREDIFPWSHKIALFK